MNTAVFLWLALVFFAIIFAIVGWMKNLASRLKDKEGKSLPVFFKFKKEILPILLVFWSFVIILFLIFGWDWLWVIGVWASVSTIMLWPCARHFGRNYLSYRTPLFIIGVLSMVALPIFGFLMDWLPKDESRTWALLITIAVLTIFSIVAGVKRAISRPTQMLFRPDLLFGDGRVLATGVLSLGLAMRFLYGPVPPGHFLPFPKGEWYALLFAITFGIVQIIPLRGMLKLRLRMARMIYKKFTGWLWVFIRETYFLVAAVLIMYGFHNVFMGKIPFIDASLGGMKPENFATMGKPGLILMAVSALIFIFIRGAYKKSVCGDPFIKETLNQSIIKSFLFLVSFLPFIYGFAHVMATMGPGGAGVAAFPRPLPEGAPLIVGGSLLVWGILMLSVIRVWIQQVQQRAIVEQLVAVVLPRLSEDKRKELMRNVMESISQIEENRRRSFIKSMLSGLESAPENTREQISATRTQVLAELPEHQRKTIMKSMDAVMLKMT